MIQASNADRCEWTMSVNGLYLPRTMIPAPGSFRKDAGNSPDPAGKHRKWLEDGSSIPVENCPDFSGGFLPNSCAFRQEATGNHWKKSGKFPTGILLP